MLDDDVAALRRAALSGLLARSRPAAQRPFAESQMGEARPWEPIVNGNIDLNNRPIVRNPDGSISTVRSISVGLDNGQTALIPTVLTHPYPRVASNDEAIQHFLTSGEHLGIFANERAADTYAQNLHQMQARQYLPLAAAATAKMQAAAPQTPVLGSAVGTGRRF